MKQERSDARNGTGWPHPLCVTSKHIILSLTGNAWMPREAQHFYRYFFIIIIIFKHIKTKYLIDDEKLFLFL